jgi:hypothetical protein
MGVGLVRVDWRISTYGRREAVLHRRNGCYDTFQLTSPATLWRRVNKLVVRIVAEWQENDGACVALVFGAEGMAGDL